ncbi:DUF397 domain-containing protein [Streptomyces sp. Li-HN-5-11]|uniref:DUF397 domain-containing protein n=1 Tax=Streptomyces sp. Li-HN-5-11 TaxID=3075432 RepID=UPI0028A83676|nr:DUF397 domain-containing protein [Streptomyces sp. Li-HN-5-11]WNM31480.1 DUF397 domain-containing protein [Streptomyces sp. Li-HN-5-11]
MNAHAHQPPIDQLAWRKSSYSSEEGGECVEVAICPRTVRIRDSKDTTRTPLAVDPTAWTAFVEFAAL